MRSETRTLLTRSALPWAAAATVSVANVYVLHSGRSVPPLGIAIAAFGMPYVVWWLATPSIAAIVRRVDVHFSPRSIATHAAWAGLFALVPTAVVVSAIEVIGVPGMLRGWWWEYRALLAIRFGADLMTYVAVVGLLKMVATANHRREEATRQARLEAELAEARLQSVVGQLQPHFLFNAMNSVAMLIRANENAAALKALLGYSDLLRSALRARDSEVPLHEEVELARKYVAIEDMRAPDVLTLHVDVPADTGAALVPPLILQPLVENALRHGLTGVLSGGTIHITAARENGKLLLAVRDNGAGLPDDWREGVGLRTTRERIRLRHGSAAGLEIRPAPERGTEVRVFLPFRTSPGR